MNALLGILGLLLIPTIPLAIIGLAIGIPLWIRSKNKRRNRELYLRHLVRCPRCDSLSYRGRITTGELICKHCRFVWSPRDYDQIYYQKVNKQ